MRRILFSILIFSTLFLLAFGISLLAWPDWLQQKRWPLNLAQTLVVGGLVLIANLIISWTLSFLFEDTDFKERLKYWVRNKYKDISVILDNFTKDQIDKEIKSRKYIPDIFVESTFVKEKLRYFCEPNIFLRKIIEKNERAYKGNSLILLLIKIHYPVDISNYPNPPIKIRNLEALNQEISRYKEWFTPQKDILNILIRGNGVGIKTEMLSNIPREYSHLYKYSYANLQFFHHFEDYLKQTDETIELLTNNVVIIKGAAGHGKTNLICDFVNNFLLKKKHICIYLSARSFNSLDKQETIEHFFERVIFTGLNFSFSDIIRLLKFKGKFNHLFILVDGLNEHTDPALFCSALEQFIQRCERLRVKLILTCRSEYFDDRYGELLRVRKLSLIDMDSWWNKNQIPDVHQQVLISRYFSEFGIQMTLGEIHPEIIKIFNDDKLLLRLFCEAYEMERPADYLKDLYKLEIFCKYYEKQLTAIQGLQECLSEITSWMVVHNQFSNFSISNLSKEALRVVEATVYENVIIKKDIEKIPDVAFSKHEVINFVYDEFRDFLIASQILALWQGDKDKAKEQIELFTKPESQIAEGLQRYLCLWAIKNREYLLIHVLSKFKWFYSIYIDSVFNTPDNYISDAIAKDILKLLGSTPRITLRIFYFLHNRLDTKQYPQLNIDNLFAFLSNISNDIYLNLFAEAVNIEYSFGITYLVHICQEIAETFEKHNISKENTPKAIRLLCYLIAIKNKEYPHYWPKDYRFGQYPSKDAILEISKIIDKQIIIHEIGEVLLVSSNTSVNKMLQDLMEIFGVK